MPCLARRRIDQRRNARPSAIDVERLLYFLAALPGFFNKITRDQFVQSSQRDGMRLMCLRVQPVREAHESVERRAIAPEQGSCLDEVAAVGDQVPVTREPSQPLHCEEIDEFGLEDFVRRMRIYTMPQSRS